MLDKALQAIAELYGWKIEGTTHLASGLINTTSLVQTDKGKFIVQQLNTKVFTKPQIIHNNIALVNAYLQKHAPNYLFLAPIATASQVHLHLLNGYYYRVFIYLDNTQTIQVVENENQAFEAACQFGKFTSLLNGFNATQLQDTLTNFHNPTLSYNQFTHAIATANAQRLKQASKLIEQVFEQEKICQRYVYFTQHTHTHKRVTHHDTKISNVLFDATGKGVAIIDLDTMMAGYFLSDVGDMIRTYTCPVSEEEKSTNLIEVRKLYLAALREGYLQNMHAQLNKFELEHFYFAGEVLIYMHAVRFLTDYLNNDVYYHTTYTDQNFVRANNQLALLIAFQKLIKEM
jgi:thiamine kinase-like enzyme